VPAEFEPDVAAYREATEQLDVVVSECFCVCDELCVGGSPDRVYRLRKPLVAGGEVLEPAGALLIGDIKTGSSLTFGHIGFSVQMAVYAHSKRYDLSEGRTVAWKGRDIPVGVRSEWVPGERVSTEWGLIVHVPSGEGRASLHPVNLAAGWELARLAVDVREWRKRKDLIGTSVELAPDFVSACAAAKDVAELTALYQHAMVLDAWDDMLRARFTRRRRELEEAKRAAEEAELAAKAEEERLRAEHERFGPCPCQDEPVQTPDAEYADRLSQTVCQLCGRPAWVVVV
jgi:hypothetical protein